MEGASWLAKKSQVEADKHISKLVQLITDFDKRTLMSVVDARINEVDGKQVFANKEWLKHELGREVNELNTRYRNLFENVNYELSKALERNKSMAEQRNV
jgi:3-phosphoglycerate kinase